MMITLKSNMAFRLGFSLTLLDHSYFECVVNDDYSQV
jgi:hypothetical protein